MGKTKNRGRYQSISLSVDFIKEITTYVKNSTKYKSVADFTREALREKLDNERMLHLGVTPKYKPVVDFNKKQMEEMINEILTKSIVGVVEKSVTEVLKKKKQEINNNHGLL